MTWRVEFDRKARKALSTFPRTTQERIVSALAQLARDPHWARQVKQLSGRDEFRLRVGDYRVLYTLEEDLLIVHVVDVAHRREAYR